MKLGEFLAERGVATVSEHQVVTSAQVVAEMQDEARRVGREAIDEALGAVNLSYGSRQTSSGKRIGASPC
jgi:hypothetical protein